jgi:outer membrane receptor protein involved in Fe transport
VAIPELRQRISALVERRREAFQPTDANPRIGEGFDRERLSTSLAIEDALALVDGRVVLTAAYRHREARDNYFGPLPFGRPPTERESPHWATAHGPSAGLVVRPTRSLVLKATRSHHERFPTLFELFGTGGEVRPNPELVPETGVAWDGGVIWRRSAGAERDDARMRHRTIDARVELGAFHSRRDSLIVLVQDSASSFKPLNLSSAEVRGVELAFDVGVPLALPMLPFLDRLRVEGSFTSQDARQHSDAPYYDERWVPYASPRELFLRTELVHDRPGGRVSIRHEYRFFDRFYRDRANRPDRKVTPRRLHAFGVRAGLLSDRLGLDLDVDNAFDAHIDDVYGFPIPGRTISLTLAVELAR